jgi:hypothetical protein
MRSYVALVALALALGVPSVAAAETPPRDAEVARLLEAKDTLRWTQVWAGQRYGHAETLVRAPFEAVKKDLADPSKLHELHGRFASARVVAKASDHTDVYLGLTTSDPAKPTWEVLRFGQPKSTAPGYAVVEARATAGKVRHGHLVLSARRVDDRHTLVKVDVLLVPNVVPAPAVLDDDLRAFASDLAGGLRTRAQGTNEPVTTLSAEPVRVSSK